MRPSRRSRRRRPAWWARGPASPPPWRVVWGRPVYRPAGEVSKKYSEIEELYQKLSSRYPTATLPPLPKKVLFVGESDIRERRAVFNEILRCVSKDAELAGSPELLEFLGTRSPGAADLTSRDVSVLDTPNQARDDGEAFDFFKQQDRAELEALPIPGREGEDAGKSSEEEEEEALDPLGIMRSKKPKKHPEVAVKPKPSPRLTIFDEEVDPDEGLFGPGTKPAPQRPAEDAPLQDPLKLFEDPDLGGAVPLGDPLLLPAAQESGGRVSHAELFRYRPSLTCSPVSPESSLDRARDPSPCESVSPASASSGRHLGPSEAGACGWALTRRQWWGLGQGWGWAAAQGSSARSRRSFMNTSFCLCFHTHTFHSLCEE
ncbi:HCLS1-binding protein 3 isoform X3 [Ursus arctos]|uniref:HCLS1-binding protein 3 isoform X3 n=1 Tax=Ursus arctos TaxID=9644 RepID=UPI00254813D2|nr:HCLS1-binding protein 3 isoform X3 [Ursus arctos]